MSDAHVLENTKTGEFAAPWGYAQTGRCRVLNAALSFDNAGEAARYKRCNMLHPEEWREVRVSDYLD